MSVYPGLHFVVWLKGFQTFAHCCLRLHVCEVHKIWCRATKGCRQVRFTPVCCKARVYFSPHPWIYRHPLLWGVGVREGLAPADSEVRNLHLIAVCQPMMWMCRPWSFSTPLSPSLSVCLSERCGLSNSDNTIILKSLARVCQPVALKPIYSQPVNATIAAPAPLARAARASRLRVVGGGDWIQTRGKQECFFRFQRV